MNEKEKIKLATAIEIIARAYLEIVMTKKEKIELAIKIIKAGTCKGMIGCYECFLDRICSKRSSVRCKSCGIETAREYLKTLL